MIRNYTSSTTRNCPFCVTPIKQDQDPVFCFDCKKPHHKECWEYNLNHCASFGCKGNKIDETYAIPPLPKPKPPAPEPIIVETPAPKVETRQLKLKPLKKTTKGKSVKLSDLIKTGNLPEKLGSVPKPDAYIPDYVYEELKKPFFLDPKKNNKRNIKKAFPLPVIKYPKKKEEPEYEPVPPPENFIPEYVTTDLRPKETKKRRRFLPSLLKFQVGTLNNTTLTPNKNNQVDYKTIPKPDPFIPEYVNSRITELSFGKRKKKKIPKYFKPLVKYPDFPLEEKDTYIPFEKPEPFIPDYVYAGMEEGEEKKELPKLLLPEKLIKTKKCIYCEETIKVELSRCNFCKREQVKSSYVYLKPPIEKNIETSENKSDVEFTTIYVNSISLRSLALHKNASYIAFGSKDKTLKLWDLNKKEVIKTFEGHSNWINSVDFSPDGKSVATGSVDTTIRIWDLESGECKLEIKGNTMGFNYIKYSPDGDYIISASGEGIIKVWESFNGLCVRNLKADMSWVNFATFSPDMEYVASCDSDNMIRIWKILESRHIKTMMGHFDSVNSIAFSPSGRFLASASNDNTIKIWDLHGLEPVKTLMGHFDSVNSIAYSPDGRYITSCSNDKTVKVWDIQERRCIRNMTGHTLPVNTVVYGFNGTYIISGSDDRSIRIWYLV